MKHFPKLTLFLLALLLPATAYAYNFEVDGIYYNIDGNNAIVTDADNYWETPDYSGDVTIPEIVTYNGTTYSVTAIGYSAFKGCSGLTNIVIPNSVTSIGSFAFSECSGLTNIVIPNSVTSIGDYAFSECSGLTNIDIPNSVTSIGDYAFSGCSGLTNIDIPNSVTTIGHGAFNGCSGLTSIDIPNSVTTIVNFMFNHCSGLTRVTIPNSVTTIGHGAFNGCSRLASIDIPNYVTTIGNSAFSGCSGLTSLTIPSSVTSIGNRAFYECYSLTTLNFNAIVCADFSYDTPFCNLNISIINIGDNVQRIPAYFAYKLPQLTNVTIPNSITSIGECAFQGCSALNTLNFNAVLCDDFISTATKRPFFGLNISTINIGDNVEKIPAYFAHGMTSLTNTTIGNSVASIGSYAFYNCTNLASIVIPNSVTSICSYAFYNCSGLTSIDIPNSVNSIASGAFYNCSGLTNINISNTITTIENFSFRNCSGLSNLTIPNSVTYIASYAFNGCSGLTSITIPSAVTSIGEAAFQGCSAADTLNFNAVYCEDFNSSTSSNPFYNLNISTINIGDSVQVVPACFADKMTKLKTIKIGKAVTTIGKYAFRNCLEMTNVDLPSSVISIGNGAFSGCSGLSSVTIHDLDAWCRISFGNSTSNPCNYAHHLYVNGNEVIELTIPNSVTDIGNFVFEGCSALTSVTIPNSVTSIGINAFEGCFNLNHLYFNAISCSDFSATASESPFYNLGISTINIGDSVQCIPAYLAYGLTQLTCITIGNSVTSIGKYAFYGCTGIRGPITIPESVTFIGNQAFNNVPSIEAVTCAAETPPSWNDIAMFTTNVYNHSPLYIPVSSVRAYQADQCWGQFATIVGKNINDEILTTSISLNLSHINLTMGSTSQLLASVEPDSTTNKMVTWTSTHPDIASVDTTGMVSAISPGTAIITATTTDGSNLSASCVVTVTEDLSDYDNYLLLNDAEAFHGDTIVIPVMMTNANSITAFQTDIFLPEGLELLKEDDEYIIDPSERMTHTHSIMSSDVASGAIRVLCYSSNYKPFTGESGDELFYITVKVADDAEGDYIIELKNTLLTNTDFVDLPAPDVAATINVKAYLLGDANNNGTVTVGDVVATAQYVLEQNPQPFNFEAADVNEDNYITVADVARIAWMVLNPTAYAPMRAPALWNNGDRMSGENISLMPGETRRVSIMLDNEMDYSAFQLDMRLPEGLTASNFNLTDRAGSHAFDVNTLKNGSVRALCYSPALTAIGGHEGALLTFDVTATGTVFGDITVDGIEMVTTDCQSVWLDGFAISVNNTTAINELANGKTVARVDYFDLTGQQVDSPESGVTLVVTTYTDGTRTTSKVFK